MNETTHSIEHYTTFGSTLYQAYELGSKEWKLGFTVGLGQRPTENPAILSRVGTAYLDCTTVLCPARSRLCPNFCLKLNHKLLTQNATYGRIIKGAGYLLMITHKCHLL